MDQDEPVVLLRGDKDYSTVLADVWFELALESGGWASLYVGADVGSRPCCQTLRLGLSNAFDPMQDLAGFAELAFKRNLPHSIEVDSEGPVSVLSIAPIPGSEHAILEIRERFSPVVLFAAEVDPVQLGTALASALRFAIEDEGVDSYWKQWFMDYDNTERWQPNYLGNSWLQSVDLTETKTSDWSFKGIETINATQYPAIAYRGRFSSSQPGWSPRVSIRIERTGPGRIAFNVAFSATSGVGTTSPIPMVADSSTLHWLVILVKQLREGKTIATVAYGADHDEREIRVERVAGSPLVWFIARHIREPIIWFAGMVEPVQLADELAVALRTFVTELEQHPADAVVWGLDGSRGSRYWIDQVLFADAQDGG